MSVMLRKAIEQDLPLMMAWRSNPLVYEEGCYTQSSPLTWEEHYTWWCSRGRWWRFFIIQINDGETTRDVGVVNFGQLDNWNPELNYYLGEVSLWNQGIATEALKMGLDWLRARGYCKVHTTMKDTNKRATAVLNKLGFSQSGKARKGESVWELTLLEGEGSQEYTSGRKEL